MRVVEITFLFWSHNIDACIYTCIYYEGARYDHVFYLFSYYSFHWFCRYFSCAANVDRINLCEMI